MKKLPNGNYELTRNELFALIKDSEELNALYYNGVEGWAEKTEGFHEYINERLYEVDVPHSSDDELDIDMIVDVIIDKIELELNMDKIKVTHIFTDEEIELCVDKIQQIDVFLDGAIDDKHVVTRGIKYDDKWIFVKESCNTIYSKIGYARLSSKDKLYIKSELNKTYGVTKNETI